MSWFWTIAIAVWLFGIAALWDEVCEVLARACRLVLAGIERWGVS